MITSLARVAFNRGLVDRLGLARALDVKRIQMSAQVMVNWMSRVLGSMMLRPGLGLLGEIYNDQPTKMLPFIFSVAQTALLELTPGQMRVWINDALLTRVAVSTAVTNGTFVGSLTGWTSEPESGATVTWISAGLVQFVGTGTARAILIQSLAIASGDQNKEQALRIVVSHGPITFMAGTTDGDDSYVTRTVLDTGNHSLAFTPTGGTVVIRFESYAQQQINLQSCVIEGAGVMVLPTNWQSADLQNVRYDQSADIVFVACSGQVQQKIERRGSGTSWSVDLYHADDGPFLIENTGPITMTPGALTGNTTLTASQNYFKAGHVGALFSQTSNGQAVSAALAAQNTFTNSIKVTGVGSGRTFQITITGTWSGTINRQYSLVSGTGPWIDVPGGQLTANIDTPLYDGFDNSIIWYRMGFETGNYVSGTANVSLTFPGGSIRGIGRVTSISSATVANIEVLTAFGGTSPNTIWEEGSWSTVQGFPTSVCFFEGRLFWAGKDELQGSASNAFETYDPTDTSDAAAIDEVIGSGPVDTINWILPLTRLVLGGQAAEHTCKSSALDQPLTPTNFAIKATSTQGSAILEAVKIDSGGIFIQRGGIRIFSLDFSIQSYDYTATHLSAIVPRIGSPGIVRVGVQRQPDTRVHFVRSDGTVVVLVFDKVEDVTCFLLITSPAAGGIIEDVVVLPSQPGQEEDQVYYVVKRTINGVPKRYLEKWALEQECLGGTLNRVADCHQTFTYGAPTSVITGLPWLGESVVVWADGKDVGTVISTDGNGTRSQTYSVDLSGNLTPPLATPATNVVIGLPYSAQWQSAKIKDFQMPNGTALMAKENVDHLGLVLADVYQNGLLFGPDFSHMADMNQLSQEDVYDPDLIVTDFDDDPFIFPGEWSNDSRICLQANAPRPCTVLALTMSVTANG